LYLIPQTLYKKMFFSDSEKEIIVKSIKLAEKNTSGEIKVHIEPICEIDTFERAKQVFFKLELDKTEQRNAVLFYLAYEDHKFAILGDEGIDKVVPSDFWNRIKELLQKYFSQGAFVSGLCDGIERAGEQLKHFFPYQSDDINELSDDISDDISLG
jgi:uncharacterized membrane protein